MVYIKREGSGRRGGSRDDKKGPMKPGARRRPKRDDLDGRMRRKTCRFCEEKIDTLDYKDTKRMERLISERGKILSRRVTGTCARHQRCVVEAIKRARFIALLPFLKK